MEGDAPIDRARPHIACVFEFERGFAKAGAAFVRFDEAAGRLALKFDSIVICNPERGDFAYPVTALAREESEREADRVTTPATTDD